MNVLKIATLTKIEKIIRKDTQDFNKKEKEKHSINLRLLSLKTALK